MSEPKTTTADPLTITEAKLYVKARGGLLKGESLAEALKRIDDPSESYEQSRMQSVMQAGRECHVCSCHIAPPCNACVNCPVCNALDETLPNENTTKLADGGDVNHAH